MVRSRIVQTLGAGGLAIALVACAGQAAQQPTPATTPRTQATAAPQPTIAIDVSALNGASGQSISLGVTGSGEIKAAQDANLTFQSQGVVDQVLTTEGQMVKKGDLLAVLDVRGFDQQVAQAEAGLANAKAQESALTEAPKALDLAAARAGVSQAQASLSQLRAGAKSQDVTSAQAAVTAAQINVQSTKDRLSFAKTQAELSLEQANFALTQSQARYAQTKFNWQYVQDTGNDPIVPKVTTATGKQLDNKLSDGQRENYYAQFVQAEAALKSAEKAQELSVKVLESARQTEITGIQAADQQVIQAQAQLDKLRLPADKDRIAAAAAAVAQARASEARLLPDPKASQKSAASAGIASAEAALTLAKINRERAELRAPFDGVIAVVNIDPGDPSTTQGQPAMQIVDISKLRVDMRISDVDIARISVGQSATIIVDGLSGKTYTGKVSSIAPTATVVGSVRTFLVKIALDNTADLRAGMSARATIQPK